MSAEFGGSEGKLSNLFVFYFLLYLEEKFFIRH
jgi:hypothetical protein